MKPATIIGLVLIVVAIIGFAMGGISFTHQKKDIDVGPVQVSHKETNTLPISPILSTLALVAGVGFDCRLAQQIVSSPDCQGWTAYQRRFQPRR